MRKWIYLGVSAFAGAAIFLIIATFGPALVVDAQSGCTQEVRLSAVANRDGLDGQNVTRAVLAAKAVLCPPASGGHGGTIIVDCSDCTVSGGLVLSDITVRGLGKGRTLLRIACGPEVGITFRGHYGELRDIWVDGSGCGGRRAVVEFEHPYEGSGVYDAIVSGNPGGACVRVAANVDANPNSGPFSIERLWATGCRDGIAYEGSGASIRLRDLTLEQMSGSGVLLKGPLDSGVANSAPLTGIRISGVHIENVAWAVTIDGASMVVVDGVEVSSEIGMLGILRLKGRLPGNTDNNVFFTGAITLDHVVGRPSLPLVVDERGGRRTVVEGVYLNPLWEDRSAPAASATDGPRR